MEIKKILLIILGLISIWFVVCINEHEKTASTPISDEPKTANDSMETEEITQKIVFVYQYTNWSDTYQNRGYYIDCAGNKVKYDVSTEAEKYADLPKLLSYLESQENVESEPCLDKNELSQYFDWLLNISLDYTLEEKSEGADRGSHCFYGIRYDKEGELIPILLAESGDWTRTNTDSYAVKIVEELRKIK